MEVYKDPFNRRTYPWGKENAQLLSHFRSLGQLRADQEVLRVGDIQFFQYGSYRLGFRRSLKGRTLTVYLNRGHDDWTVDTGRVLMARNLRCVTQKGLTLAPMGFCITEEA